MLADLHRCKTLEPRRTDRTNDRCPQFACSKQEPVAATNATVNAAMANLDSVAVARPSASKKSPAIPDRAS